MKVFILLSILFLALLAPGMLAECLTDAECRQDFDAANPPTSENFQQLAFPTSEDFQRLAEPTYLDLQRLADPTVADFQRLSGSEQRKYIQDSQFSRKDHPIAAEYFSEAGNINRDKVIFSRYARTLGTELLLQSGVDDYSRSGFLQGRDAEGKRWSINMLDSVIQNTYSLEVDHGGSLVMIKKAAGFGYGDKHHVTGAVIAEPEGSFGLETGIIDGHTVEKARKISFEGDMEVKMNVERIDGLAFAEEAPIAVEPDGVITVRFPREVKSFEEGHQVYIDGSFTVAPENYDQIKGDLRMRSGELEGELVGIKVNGLWIEARDDTSLVFQSSPLVKEHFVEALLGPLQNRVVFTPRQVSVEGEGVLIRAGHSFLSPFTAEAISSREALFSVKPERGKVLLTYDDENKQLDITAQGTVHYRSGKQNLILRDGAVNRFFTRSLGITTGVPVNLEYYDNHGYLVGKVHHSDFLSYTSEGRRVLSSMGSSLSSLGIMRDIAIGDPEKIADINVRIQRITEQWDQGIQPNKEDLEFVDGVYKSLLAGSRILHGSTAARTLYHYLEATGEPLDYDDKLFLRRPEIRYVMREMHTRIQEQIATGQGEVQITSSSVPDQIGLEETEALEEVEQSAFGRVLNGYIWTPDKELRYSFGRFVLVADARRQGDDIAVVWTVRDVYDYERDSGKQIVIPTGQLSSKLSELFKRKPETPVVTAGITPSGRSEPEKSSIQYEEVAIPDRLAAYLPDVGRAREFEMRAGWRTRCTPEGGCVVESD